MNYCNVRLSFYFVLKVSKKKNDEATKSIQLLRGKNYDCKDELNEIKKHQQMNSTELSVVEHLRQKATRKAFIIILTQFFFFQFTGINAVLFYTTTIFIEAKISIDAGIASIIVVSSQIIGTSLSVIFVDRFGRRVMLIISTISMTLSHLAIGTYFLLKNSGSSVDNLGWLPIVSLCVFQIAFGSGIGPVSYVLLGELFTPEAKKVIAPFGKSFNLFLAFIVGLIFPYLVNLIGSAGTFFMFAGFSLLALIFTIYVIPETKGKSFVEIQIMLTS